MKMKDLFAALLIWISLVSCDSNADEIQTQASQPNATVLYRGLDCGDTYVIQFDPDVTGLPNNTFNNTYYAQNLPQALKVNGLAVHLDFREVTPAEAMACSTMGPGYPHIFVTAAE